MTRVAIIDDQTHVVLNVIEQSVHEVPPTCEEHTEAQPGTYWIILTDNTVCGVGDTYTAGVFVPKKPRITSL